MSVYKVVYAICEKLQGVISLQNLASVPLDHPFLYLVYVFIFVSSFFGLFEIPLWSLNAKRGKGEGGIRGCKNSANSGIRGFSRNKLPGFREQSPFLEINGNPG